MGDKKLLFLTKEFQLINVEEMRERENHLSKGTLTTTAGKIYGQLLKKWVKVGAETEYLNIFQVSTPKYLLKLQREK